jgi:hypothetical protein
MELKRCREVAVHTPVDDLESFLWVLFYTILEIGSGRSKLEPDEVPWLEEMNGEDDTKLSSKVPCLEDLILTAQTTRKLSDHLIIFAEILGRWNDVANTAHRQLLIDIDSRLEPKEFVEKSQKVYAEYLKSGFEALQQLPLSWEEGWEEGVKLKKPRKL